VIFNNLKIIPYKSIGLKIQPMSKTYDNRKAKILAQTLDQATSRLLEEDKSPLYQVGELDNRGSHFYLALYWAQELAKQAQDLELQIQFSVLAKKLAHKEQVIVNELNSSQGHIVDLKGYYHPDKNLIKQIMCPSETFNAILMQ